MGTTVACGLCSHFRPGIGSSSALGMCRSCEPRDRHRGQWPFKNHPCRSFEAAGQAGGGACAPAETAFYVKELQSGRCMCGAKKTAGWSFCYKCYMQLPPARQKTLYAQVGSGYEAAYDAAVTWLTREGEQCRFKLAPGSMRPLTANPPAGSGS